MRHFKILGTAAGILSMAMLAGAVVNGNLKHERIEKDSTLKEINSLSLVPVNTKESQEDIRMKTRPSKVASSLLLYEDFEKASGVEPYPLPQGWKSVANPQNADNKWLAGTLYNEEGQILGTSGEKYAFVLPNVTEPHDAWMFSPGFNIESDNNYKVSFNTIMLSNRAPESFEVVLCKSQNPSESERVAVLLSKTDECKNWTSLECFINDVEAGTYYLGFHADAEANSGGLLIDDVYVSNVDAPVFLGNTTINFGKKMATNPAVTATYEVWNDGYMPLEVSLKSISSGLTVEGLPATIEQLSKKDLKITLDVSEVGHYQGEIVLETNDPFSPEVRINVVQDVAAVPMGTSKVQTFDEGTPDSYIAANPVVNNLIGDGVDGSRSLYVLKDLSKTETKSIYTDFVELGESPRFRMDYKLMQEKMMGTVVETVPADVPKISVFITDDYDMTWTPVFEIGEDKENHFDGTGDYHHVDVDLKEWANKCCRVHILIDGKLGATGMLNKASMRTYIDNIMLGTPYDTDMKVETLFGPTSIRTGEEGSYNVTVCNYGNKPASSYQLNVLNQDGETIKSFSGNNLAPYGKETFSFNWTPSTAGSYILTAECQIENDRYNNDNKSTPLSIAVSDDNMTRHIFPVDENTRQEWTQVLPVNFYAFASANADIYYANEIGINKGSIHSIEYQVKGADYRSDLFKVYIGETDLDEFSDESEWPEYSQMTKVFEGRIHFSNGEGKMVIPFDEPYEYSGKNIIVYTEHFGNEFVYGRNAQMAVSDKKRELAADCDIVMTGRESIPSDKKKAYTRYASSVFNMIDAATGSVSGIVKDLKGNIVADATVSIYGSSFTVITDEEGKFTMPRVAVGNYEMEASKSGYYNNKVEFEVKEDNESVIEIVLSDVAKQAVSGKVVDTDGNPISGAQCEFNGIIPGRTVTDEEGNFSLELFGESDYQAIITNSYYMPVRKDIHVENSPVTFDVTLDAIPSHPYSPQAALEDEAKVKINWEEPLVQRHHDNGKFEFELGYDAGYSEIIFGSAYHEHAIVKEVSWYMTDILPHEDFHVYVFGLTDGLPDAEKVLYHASDVDYRDNQWTTHVLTEPVEADGFMVAVGCTGFMGIGVTPADENHPYIPNTEFYAGDSYRFHISEMSTSAYKNNHWMLRAGIESLVEDENITKPEIEEFNVYRYDGNSNEWNKIGTTTEYEFTDNLIDLESGLYRWGVEAGYRHENSSRVYSNSLFVTINGLQQILDGNFMTFVSPNMLSISNPEIVKEINIFNESGLKIKSILNVEGFNYIEKPETGVYIAVATLKDNSIVVLRFII